MLSKLFNKINVVLILFCYSSNIVSMLSKLFNKINVVLILFCYSSNIISMWYCNNKHFCDFEMSYCFKLDYNDVAQILKQ
jgi:hypothetical protein